MNLTQQIFAQALMLAGAIEPRQEALLRLLCTSCAAGMENRLRDGIRPEDCKADFVAAASLYALAALSETDENADLESFTAGDVTVRRGNGNAAARCLRYQADLMISPYSVDRFTFRGV